jgi:Rieske Fe-S protein
MTRIEFLKNCGLACLSGVAITTILPSCASSYYFAQSTLAGNQLKVLKSEFHYLRKNQPAVRSYVVVRSENLKFPIYLHRISETEYTALWMECTHQGSELTAHGDYLSCPSHGAEFNKVGKITSGPATTDLRTFKTMIDDSFISILLA